MFFLFVFVLFVCLFVFCFTKNILRRNRSLINSTWFYPKKPAKLEKRNLYLTEKWNQTPCVTDNHNMCKSSFRYKLYLRIYEQNIKFPRSWTKFDIFPAMEILKKYWNFVDLLLLSCKFYGGACENPTCSFASCEPLTL